MRHDFHLRLFAFNPFEFAYNITQATLSDEEITKGIAHGSRRREPYLQTLEKRLIENLFVMSGNSLHPTKTG